MVASGAFKKLIHFQSFVQKCLVSCVRKQKGLPACLKNPRANIVLFRQSQDWRFVVFFKALCRLCFYDTQSCITSGLIPVPSLQKAYCTFVKSYSFKWKWRELATFFPAIFRKQTTILQAAILPCFVVVRLLFIYYNSTTKLY